MKKNKINILFGLCFAIVSLVFCLGAGQTKLFANADSTPSDELISIVFVLNNGAENVTFSGNAGDEIEFPTPEKEGCSLLGWFEDDETFEIPFEEQTLSESKTVYAKWKTNEYTIYFNTNGGNIMQFIRGEFGSSVTAPADPTKTGNEFAGWFEDSALTKPYTFTTIPSKNITIYARWRTLSYSLNFVTNSNISVESQNNYYGSTLSFPSTLQRANFTFIGWFLDENFETPMTYVTMPNRNFTIYAKWQEKQDVVVSTDKQTYNIDDVFREFRNFSSLSGFAVYYKVNNEWVLTTPTNAGTYDIKLVRYEDDTYKSFETVIAGGLEISPRTISMTWLIAFLFILAAIEFAAAIFIRRMKKLKASKTYCAIPVSLLALNQILPTSQIALLAVSGTLAVFGFVLVIYELVSTIRTNPNYDFDASKYDNRRNLKKISDDEDDFSRLETTPVSKNDNADNFTFSASDIEDMLSDPNYFNKRSNQSVSKHNLTQNEESEENSQNNDKLQTPTSDKNS
jgi:uncharacterized repeat protein (TIGR02543 family)